MSQPFPHVPSSDLQQARQKVLWQAGQESAFAERRGRLPPVAASKTNEAKEKQNNTFDRSLVLLDLLPAIIHLKPTALSQDSILRGHTHALAAYKVAEQHNVGPALIGRCAFWAGLALVLLEKSNRAGGSPVVGGEGGQCREYFEQALDAKGVYNEADWAIKWLMLLEKEDGGSEKKRGSWKSWIWSWMGEKKDAGEGEEHAAVDSETEGEEDNISSVAESEASTSASTTSPIPSFPSPPSAKTTPLAISPQTSPRSAAITFSPDTKSPPPSPFSLGVKRRPLLRQLVTGRETESTEKSKQVQELEQMEEGCSPYRATFAEAENDGKSWSADVDRGRRESGWNWRMHRRAVSAPVRPEDLV